VLRQIAGDSDKAAGLVAGFQGARYNHMGLGLTPKSLLRAGGDFEKTPLVLRPGDGSERRSITLKNNGAANSAMATRGTKTETSRGDGDEGGKNPAAGGGSRPGTAEAEGIARKLDRSPPKETIFETRIEWIEVERKLFFSRAFMAATFISSLILI